MNIVELREYDGTVTLKLKKLLFFGNLTHVLRPMGSKQDTNSYVKYASHK